MFHIFSFTNLNISIIFLFDSICGEHAQEPERKYGVKDRTFFSGSFLLGVYMLKFLKKFCNKRKRIKLYPVMTKLSLELEASKTETTSFYYYESLLKEFNGKFQVLYRANLYNYPRLNQVDYHIQQAIFFCELCAHLLDKYTKENCWDSLLQSDKEKLADYLLKSKNLVLDAIKELTNIMQDMIEYEPENS